jgi:hypothetical protein
MELEEEEEEVTEQQEGRAETTAATADGDMPAAHTVQPA